MQEKMDVSVLFVEDDPIAMERISALLGREVREVVASPDGQAGLEAFRAGRYDIVLTDIRMPRMSGIEMAREIRKLDQDVPIVMTSAYNETEYFMEAIDIGVDHYVLKPIEGGVLIRAIRKCAEKKLLHDARKKAEEDLRIANDTLEQKVRERTAELESAFRSVTEAQKEWQDTFDSIGDSIALIDSNRRVLRANRAFSTAAGLDPSEVPLKKCSEIFCGDSIDDDHCPHALTLRDSSAHAGEVRRQKDNRLFQVSTFPYVDSSGRLTGSIHIARDITEEKDREVRMIMSERLAMLGQMVAGISHELKNPLASISGCAELVRSKIMKPEWDHGKIEQLVTIIHEEAIRCGKIIDSMLSPVRKKSFESRKISIAAALDKTIELINYQGRLRNVEVEKHYCDEMPCVQAAEGDLQQIFLILLSNAIDAMQDFGKLEVRTISGPEHAVIEIRDTGAGIAPHNLNRIFDAFFTTKGDSGGTGLGLSIAAKIVSSLGGVLSIPETGPQGTTFRISLPHYRKEDAAAR